MELMRRVLGDDKDPPKSNEAFSLAAACVLVSFSSLHKKESGIQTLQHLLVHRLQGVRCETREKVTFESISQKLDGMDKRLVLEWQNPHHLDLLNDERSEDRLFLDMLDYADGQINVPPPRVPTLHWLCPSDYFGLAGNKINWEQSEKTSREIVARILNGSCTPIDQQIWQEANILHPCGQVISPGLRVTDDEKMATVYNLFKQALVFRELSSILPQVSRLVSKGPEGTVAPENFWRTQ